MHSSATAVSRFEQLWAEVVVVEHETGACSSVAEERGQQNIRRGAGLNHVETGWAASLTEPADPPERGGVFARVAQCAAVARRELEPVDSHSVQHDRVLEVARPSARAEDIDKPASMRVSASAHTRGSEGTELFSTTISARGAPVEVMCWFSAWQ